MTATSQRHLVRVVTAVLVLAALVEAWSRFHTTQDDAFISFRYATRWVDTGSLTFNGPGYERAEGYSNFTWTALLALAHAAGIGPYLAAKLLGMVCLVATILGGMRLTGELVGRDSAWRLFTGATIASSACLVSWSVQGLETLLVAALLVWSLVFLLGAWREPHPVVRRRRAWLAGLSLGVLGVSRPEAPLFGGVAIACLAVCQLLDRRTPRGSLLRVGIGFCVPVLAQLTFRWLYYERITANTVYAKVHGSGRLWRGRQYVEHWLQAQGTWIVAGALLVVGAAFAIAFRRRREEPLAAPLLLTAVVLAYTAFIVAVGGDWMRGFRFFMHVFPLVAVIGTWALAGVVGAGPRDRRLRGAAIASALAAVLYSNLVLAPSHSFGAQGALHDDSPRSMPQSLSPPKNAHWLVGEWLRDNLPAGSLVALSEAGIVPFVCNLPVLDYLGLNDRRVADLISNGSGVDTIAEHVLAQRPAAIVMTGLAHSDAGFDGRLGIDRALQQHADFVAGYHLVRTEPLAAPTAAGTLAFAVYVRH